ncbi:MAG: serine/threonine protein kinase [Alphaproteobacteria bacterium]|nr:serine/threonine protein kinase [Alphaproteobacteria bacterium]
MAAVDRRTFKVHACIGRGGYGEVYRATMFAADGEHEVALKVLHADLETSSQPVQRLRDERRMLAAIVHESILRVHDLVVLEGRIGLVTEWVEGQDLNKCTRGDDPLPPRAILEVIGGIADALDAAHHAPVGGGTLGLIHRDVKPSNIRVGRKAQAKLLDFGIARAENVQREAQTSPDNVFGSFPYMAPERFLASSSEAAGDVYALGATLFEALTAERLWMLPLPEIYKLVMNDARYGLMLEERLGTLPDELGPDVAGLIRDMAAWDPMRRPSAAEVRDRCAKLAKGIAGKDLLHWCRDRDWPELRVLPGLLSGRVFEEDVIDPQEADNIGRELAWDANDQEVTVHIRGFDEPTVLRTPPPAPRADHTTERIRSTGPSEPRRPAPAPPAPAAPSNGFRVARVVLALLVLLFVMAGVFVATFSVMLYLLQRFGG